MSLSNLPDELIETIFSFVREKAAAPGPATQQTLVSLALTSKRFVSIARSFLYFRPILPFGYRRVTWSKAVALYSALSSPLGHLVTSLEGIVDFATSLSAQGYQGPSLDLLETLASSSPSLARLDFQHSNWTPCRSSQGSPFASNDSIHGLVDPDDLLERLLEFNELIWVHLGYLPTKVEETYAILRQELQQKRGIRVDWDCCRF
ncbi:hypothetical protein JCM3766R1_000911 [Sporobolomyces carnicolor]